MKPAYVSFYLEGREDRLIKNDIDTDQIAEQVTAGKGTIHALLSAAATAAAEPLRVGRKKREWTEEFESEIKEAGGDQDEAYATYLQGRIDELAHRLEGDVVDAMHGEGEDEDGDADEEDEESDEDEDEDDDGEEDETDDKEDK